jgi:NADH-quinone oxidoreductase subunit J
VIQALFLIIAVLGLVAALGTVLARNLVHAALCLVAFFFIVACQFVLLDAEFLAAIQVLVYIGAVAILLMFAIMLTRNVQGDITTTVPRGWVIPALVAALGLFFVLAFGINNHVGIGKRQGAWSELTRRPPVVMPTRPGEAPSPRTRAVNNMGKEVGDQMLTRYALPFEVAGLLLTVALVGAVALAHREITDDPFPRRGARAARAPTANGQGTGSEPGPLTPAAPAGHAGG